MVSEDAVGLFLVLMVVVGQLVAARWVRSIPQMFRRSEWLLERKIGRHKKEMEKLNSVSSFAAYSKGQRELAKLEKELVAAQAAYRKQSTARKFAPYMVAVMAQCGFIVPVVKLVTAAELVMVPNFLGFGFFRNVAFGTDASAALGRLVTVPLAAVSSGPVRQETAQGDEWLRSIGVLPWCILSFIAWWFVKSSLLRP